MRYILGAILVLFILGLLFYILKGRAWLKAQPWLWVKSFFAWIEPIELALYKKSETLLFGRLLSVGGAVVTLYDGVAQFLPSLDLTPITARIFDAIAVPPDLRGLVTTAAIAGIGLAIGWLRKRTTKPIEQVAAPDKVG